MTLDFHAFRDENAVKEHTFHGSKIPLHPSNRKGFLFKTMDLKCLIMIIFYFIFYIFC